MNELTNSVRSIYQLSTLNLGYYFATTGESLGINSNPAGPFRGVGVGWLDAEKDAFRAVFADIEEFSNLTFTERSSHASADLTLVAESRGGEGALASLPAGSPPYYAWFDIDNFGWDTGLSRGGSSYVFMIHEIGHVLGLEHTHEDSFGGEILRDVDGPFDLGAFDLNQGIFTVMGYNEGWDRARFDVPGFEQDQLGKEGTFGPIDIALLQEYYGANTTHNSGDTTYEIVAINALGTSFDTIWDAGGEDLIRYSGSADAIIDLRAATLDYSSVGGGAVSFASGIKGGYLIANSVVIENAMGGSGNDVLTGNLAGNVLTGRQGQDMLMGVSGANTLNGGSGGNFLVGGLQDDTLIGGSGWDVIEADHLASVVFGDDTIIGGAGNDILSGGPGRDIFVFSPSQGSNTIASFEHDDVRLTGSRFTTGTLTRDFELGVDTIELSGFSGLNAGNIGSTLSSLGGDARFFHSGTSILFEGIDVGDLTSDHFTFV